MRFFSYGDRKGVAAARGRSTPPDGRGRGLRARRVRGLGVGQEVPRHGPGLARRVGAVHPLPEFPPEVRKIIYTTSSIESLNYQLRKIIKNRGHFPSDDAVIKLL